MLQLKVEAIKWETADTATFFFKEVSGKKINYNAGQFITLVFEHHHEEIRRSYSLSSSPDEELLSITVKRIANGEISRFMLTKVSVGDLINAVTPAGRFTITPSSQNKQLFFFAGGSGITPIFSQIKYLLKCEGANELVLIYSNRESNSILFKDELDQLVLQHPRRLKLIYLLSDKGDRLNNLLLEQLVRQNMTDLNNTEFYLCGPFAYMRMIRFTLLFMGVETDQIRKENFVLETVDVPRSVINYPAKPIRINFHNEVYDIIVGENQTILQAALQNNVPLPYSCRAGICSTCMALCKSGKIDMPVNDVLTDTDLRQGWILTCTGHPVTDDAEIEFL